MSIVLFEYFNNKFMYIAKKNKNTKTNKQLGNFLKEKQ